MKLKKLALAAGLAAALPAFAQTGSSLALYGIIDVSVRHQQGFAANYVRSAADTTTVASGVGPTSRWGIRGTEDLGGGMRALFNLESGINADTGAPSNSVTYFDRASIVGLAGRWGQLTVGRQNTLLADSAGRNDPIQLRFAGLNPNIQVASLTGHQLGVEFGPTASSGSSNRVNNSLKYSLPLGGFTARAMYAAGEQNDDTMRRSAMGLGLDYDNKTVSATSAYMSFRDINGRQLDAGNIGASWRALPALRVMANVAFNDGETSPTTETRNRLWALGVNYAVTPAVDVLAGWYDVDRERTGQADDGFRRLIAFVDYKFSRRTRVFLEFDHTRWDGNYIAATGRSTSKGVAVGITHSF